MIQSLLMLHEHYLSGKVSQNMQKLQKSSHFGKITNLSMAYLTRGWVDARVPPDLSRSMVVLNTSKLVIGVLETFGWFCCSRKPMLFDDF